MIIKSEVRIGLSNGSYIIKKLKKKSLWFDLTILLVHIFLKSYSKDLCCLFIYVKISLIIIVNFSAATYLIS